MTVCIEKLIQKIIAGMENAHPPFTVILAPTKRKLARAALAVVHKHLSPSAVEDCIEDNVQPTIDETIMGVKEAAQDIRKLIAPPREKK